ncbi:MAG: molybdopterin-dependent oxidoreductase [Anaerolineaceae bacterium]|nr:molybdopterin-dependent oxidoreductase [Anaerolineaceae bacterium]
MVNVTIDGKLIEVPDGTTVLQAARQAEIQIPTLCDHPNLTPYGGCRLCLVEVDGLRTMQPSCTLPVNNNMVIHTDTEKVREARKFVLTLIFSERNHFCMYCQKSGGDCELQNCAYAEGMTHWPLQPNWAAYPVDASHPDFVLDHNRCILCRRCVRACGELVGNYTLGFEERGANSFLVADLGTPLGESSCVGCGTCVQICPTGALIDRQSAYMGREIQVNTVASTCNGCSIGCGIQVVTRDDQLLRIDGDWESPVNQGVLCNLGRFQPLKEERERILTPLVRKNGGLKAATWEEALGVIQSHLRSDQVTAIASNRLPAESLALFKQIFADHLGSQNVTSTAEGQTTAAAEKLAKELGHPFEGKLDQLKTADLVVTIGVDLAENYQVAGFFVKRNLQNGTKLIVIDPSDTGLNDLADLVLKVAPGTDADLLYGLAAEVGRLTGSKPGFEAEKYTASTVSQKTGILPEKIETAASLLVAAKHPVFVYGKGITAHGNMIALKSLVELARALGALDEAHSAIIGAKGQANSLTAALLGLDNGVEVNGAQAVYLAAGDDVVSQRLIKKLEGVPFLAVQASYTSAVTIMADVVLPVEIWAEQSGHYVSLDGRIQATHTALPAPEGVWSNEKVLHALGSSLGVTADIDWHDTLLQSPSPVALYGD